MCPVELWCRVTVVGPDGAELASHVLSGPGAPDMGTVDDVARLALRAGRLGGGAVLTDVCPALQALLELTGLGAEVKWQAELGEEPLGAQEGQEPRHTGDLSP
jgi:hypothetical protein